MHSLMAQTRKSGTFLFSSPSACNGAWFIVRSQSVLGSNYFCLGSKKDKTVVQISSETVRKNFLEKGGLELSF